MHRVFVCGFLSVLMLSLGDVAFALEGEAETSETVAPEVVAARSSAKTHNRRVDHAKAELEDAIERARKKYVAQVIQAKERLIADLRRTLRDAAESDRPENLLAISRQIEKLDKQIEMLKETGAANEVPDSVGVASAGDQAGGETPGRFERYHGRWMLTWPNGHKRRFDIDSNGKVSIRYNSSGNGPTSGVGSTYQANLLPGNVIAFHDTQWTKGKRPDGRILLLRINDDATVTVGYSEKNLEQADTLQTANEVWTAKRVMVFTPLAKADLPPAEQRDPEAAPQPQVDERVEANDADTDDAPAETGDTFFGVPIE
jgi:hypothetical protein